MEIRYRKLQLDMLNKLHETDFDIDMHLDLWHPDRRCIDHLFSLEGFSVDPNDKSNTICSFNSRERNVVSITIFCNDEDAEYLQTQIKKRREVNK